MLLVHITQRAGMAYSQSLLELVLFFVCLAQWFLTVQQFSIEIVKCLGPLDQDDTLFKYLETVMSLM